METVTARVGCERTDGLLNVLPEASTFYRFHEIRYSGRVLMLVKSTYPVLKKTETGVWLDVFGCRRFCRTDARKRFACPTEQEALDSYHARKRRQVRILRRQLAEAEAALRLKTDGESTYVSAVYDA